MIVSFYFKKMLSEFQKKLFKNFNKINQYQIEEILLSLFEEKNTLQDIADSVPLAIIVLNSKGEIIFYNEYSKNFFATKKNLLGKSFSSLLNNNELEQTIIATLKEIAKNEKNHFKEITIFDFLLRDLGIWFYKAKKKLENKQVKKENQVIFIADITHWKNRSLEEVQKSSIHSLNTLTAGIAHEIKNPLGALDLHLQLINRFIKKTPIENKEEIQENINIINDEIKRLDSILNDFLHSFRPIKAIKKPVYLSEVIEEVITLLKVELKEKNVVIKKKLTTKKKPFLFDENQIKQMLINLVKNSLAAILEFEEEKKGIITILTEEKKENLILTIQDNGIGIPQKEMANVFKPFYTTKKMGTGLGLSIISRIVREHNGEIIINSNYKKGTEIIIEFKRHVPSLSFSSD